MRLVQTENAPLPAASPADRLLDIDAETFRNNEQMIGLARKSGYDFLPAPYDWRQVGIEKVLQPGREQLASVRPGRPGVQLHAAAVAPRGVRDLQRNRVGQLQRPHLVRADVERQVQLEPLARGVNPGGRSRAASVGLGRARWRAGRDEEGAWKPSRSTATRRALPRHAAPSTRPTPCTSPPTRASAC